MPLTLFAQDTPLRGSTRQDVGNFRCAAGQGVENGFDPLKEGEVCMREPISGDQVGLECKDIANPVITSICKSGKCVASLKCDGKPLEDKPYEIPGGSSGKDDPLKPAPTPTPTPSTPTPSPTPSAPQPSTPSPSPSAPSIPSGGSGGGGTSGSVRPSPTGEGWEGELISESPKPVTPPKPGTTFTDSGSPFTLKPGTKPSIGGIISGNGEYLDGVFSGGNPFGNTFGDASPSFGGTGAAAGFNLFSNFISTIGSLFGGFGGGGGLSSGNSSPTPAPAPAPTPQPQPQPQPTPVTTKPPVQVADAAAQDRLKALDEKLKRLNESRGIDINKPTQSPLDLPLERNILTGFPIVPLQPADRIGLPTVGSGEPLIGGTPRGTLPPAVVKDAENPSGITVPIPEVTPLPPSVVTTIIPTTAAEAFAAVEETREALDDRSWFGEMLDWVGIGSKEGVAYRQALNELKAASMREGLEKIAADVRAIPSTVQVAQGGSVMTDATPPEAEALENTLTPQQRAQFEREYNELVQEFDAATTDEERSAIINKKFDELRAIDPAIEKALEGTTFEIDLESEIAAAAPQPAPTPSRLLEGLSKIGERVAEAARTAIDRLGYVLGVGASIPEGVEIPVTETSAQPEPTPTPEPEPTPMPDTKPAPTPAPAPQPAPQPDPKPTQTQQSASRPNSFLQGGLGILSALLGTVLNFFNDDDSNSAPTTPEPKPTQSAAAASITANPSSIDDGDTSELSWTSVGTLSCVVVDSTLNVIKRGGKDGELTTPALNSSTRFGVICDIESGKDKFVNETLVRVNGDENEPKRLFAQSGRVSTAAPVQGGSGAEAGASGGSSSNPNPIDVRTCNPEQSMDTFIKCLCEAEPNPNGCSLVQ